MIWLGIIAGFILGALHQRHIMIRRVKDYAQTGTGRKISRAIVLAEWAETVKDPAMRPHLQQLLDAASEGDR